MKDFIFKVFLLLSVCLLSSSCENLGKALKENNPLGVHQSMKRAQERLMEKLVDNKSLYDSLLLKNDTMDSLVIRDVENVRDKVQSFLNITAKCDSIAMNCNCKNAYEKLKPTLPSLYSSMVEINQSFSRILENHQLKVKIEGEILDENSTQESREKIMFYDLDGMTISTILLSQKVDALLKEKEILEKLIQKQHASKANHQN